MSALELTEQERAAQRARRVTCPSCGAWPGKDCFDIGTGRARYDDPHAARQAAAERRVAS